MNTPLALIVSLCITTGCAINNCSPVNASQRTRIAKEVLTDSNSTPAAISLAISDLSAAHLPPSFWVSLANDPQYSNAGRSVFIYELFRRCVHPGMALDELARVVGPAIWVEDENVIEVKGGSGTFPVRVSRGDRLYLIRVLPDEAAARVAIYMTFEESVAKADLLRALAGTEIGTRSHARIKDIGLIPLRSEMIQVRH
jgi:hypothetical protein